MKVRCSFRRGDKLPMDVIAAGVTAETVLHITFGKIYIVYAMGLWNEHLAYLILADDCYRPDWYEASLFDVVDRRIPTCWQYNHWHPRDENHLVPQQDLVAIWGYPELVDDSGENYVNLIEREQEALSAFFRRRAEIDEELDFL